MTTVALVLYVTALVVLFGVRSWVQYRRTGSSGFHGIPGSPADAGWWGVVLLVVATALGLQRGLPHSDPLKPVGRPLRGSLVSGRGLPLRQSRDGGRIGGRHAQGAVEPSAIGVACWATSGNVTVSQSGSSAKCASESASSSADLRSTIGSSSGSGLASRRAR